MYSDLINGIFEGGGAILLTLSIRKLLKDKKVAGISYAPVTFWTVWGYWNLFYYPSLHQWASFIGGIGVVVMNTIWLALAFYYRNKETA
jgi:hypothetical protein